MTHTIPQHPIQKYIVKTLTHKETARFSELRAPGVDSNLFSYHLKLLIRDGFVAKHDKDYTLGVNGLIYVDYEDTELSTLHHQPKVITMLLVQNGYGEVLVQKRKKQPYINAWTLPHGKIHIDDLSINAAAKREAKEKLDLQDPDVRHVGDCYIRTYADGAILSSTFVHVFRYETDELFSDESIMWIDPLKLGRYHVAPVVEQIISRSFFGDDHFFAEFEHEWSALTR